MMLSQVMMQALRKALLAAVFHLCRILEMDSGALAARTVGHHVCYYRHALIRILHNPLSQHIESVLINVLDDKVHLRLALALLLQSFNTLCVLLHFLIIICSHVYPRTHAPLANRP